MMMQHKCLLPNANLVNVAASYTQIVVIVQSMLRQKSCRPTLLVHNTEHLKNAHRFRGRRQILRHCVRYMVLQSKRCPSNCTPLSPSAVVWMRGNTFEPKGCNETTHMNSNGKTCEHYPWIGATYCQARGGETVLLGEGVRCSHTLTSPHIHPNSQNIPKRNTWIE